MSEDEARDPSGAESGTETVELGAWQKRAAETRQKVEAHIEELSIADTLPDATEEEVIEEQQDRDGYVEKVKQQFKDQKSIVDEERALLEVGVSATHHAEDVLVSTTALLTLASHDLISDVPEASTLVIKSIDSNLGQLITPTAAIHLHSLIDHLVSESPSIDTLRADFREIKGKYRNQEFIKQLSKSLIAEKEAYGLGGVDDAFLQKHYFNAEQLSGEPTERSKMAVAELEEVLEQANYELPDDYDILDDAAKQVHDTIWSEMNEKKSELISSVMTDYQLLGMEMDSAREGIVEMSESQEKSVLSATKKMLYIIEKGHVNAQSPQAEQILKDLSTVLSEGLDANTALQIQPIVRYFQTQDNLDVREMSMLYDLLRENRISNSTLQKISSSIIANKDNMGFGAMEDDQMKELFPATKKDARAGAKERMSPQQKVAMEREEIHKELNGCINSDGSPNEQGRRELVDNVRSTFDDLDTYAEVMRDNGPQNGLPSIEQESVRTSLVQMIELLKEHNDYFADPPSQGVLELIPHLSDFVDRAAMMGDLDVLSAYLHPMLQTMLSEGELTSDLLKSSLSHIKSSQLLSVAHIHTSVGEMLGKMGDTIEGSPTVFSGEFHNEVEQALELDDRQEYENSVNREVNFERDWNNYFDSRFGPEGKRIIRAIYSLENFEEYFAEEREKLEVELGVAGNDPGLQLQLSETIERDIINIYSGLFQTFDYKRPKEFFENQMQEGFTDSIAIAKRQIDLALDQLMKNYNDGKGDRGEFASAKFFKRTTVSKLHEVEIEKSDRENKSVMQYRTMPTAGYKDGVGLADFINYVKEGGSTMIDIRGYNHNVQAILLGGAGGKNPWEVMKGYAEKMEATDVDNIWLLPDSDMWKEANAIYIRLLRYEFAKLDYRHDATLFSPDNEQRTKVQQMAEEELKIAFPELASKEHENRLKLAISMGVGLSQGVLLNEIELAAHADPVISAEGGKATFQSYYFENGLLPPLNNAHNTVRWQTDREQALWHTLVRIGEQDKDAKRSVKRFHHGMLFEQREKYYKSFKDGAKARESAENDEDGENSNGTKMFVDVMDNVAGLGGWASRATSWRMQSAYEGVLKREQGTDKVDVEASWNALENIGVQPLEIFSGSDDFKDFLSPESVKTRLEKKKAETEEDGLGLSRREEEKLDDLQENLDVHQSNRDVFLANQFKKYIEPYVNPDGTVSSDRAQEQYVDTIKDDLREEYNELSDEEKKETREEDFIKKGINPRLVSNALAYARWQRDPTTIINHERDRLSEDGTRIYEVIRRNLNPEEGDEFKMDRAMHNIIAVTSAVRTRTSEDMKSHLRDQSLEEGQEMDLSTFDARGKYQVSKDTIEEVLRENKGYEEMNDTEKAELDEEVEQTKKLYEEMSKVAQEKDFIEAYAQKMRNGDLRFSQGAEEMDFSFLALKNNGQRTIARGVGEIHSLGVEKIQETLHQLPEVLAAVAIKEHSYEPLVELIKGVKEGLQSVHGEAKATKLASDLAVLTTFYFKKDLNAINPLQPFLTGKRREPHSLAAEFAGASSRVWEWDNLDIYSFSKALEAADVLPRRAHSIASRDTKVKRGGIFKSSRQIEYHEDDGIVTSEDFRKMVGATWGGVGRDMLIKYGPAAVGGIAIFTAIMAWKAINEEAKK